VTRSIHLFGSMTALVVATALLVSACAGVPEPTLSINDKIAWSGNVFEPAAAASVEAFMSEDQARQLVADYPPVVNYGLVVAGLHPGRLSPNVSGEGHFGYVVEVAPADGGDGVVILINAETQELAGAQQFPDPQTP
jgi:hypothetical protein